MMLCGARSSSLWQQEHVKMREVKKYHIANLQKKFSLFFAIETIDRWGFGALNNPLFWFSCQGLLYWLSLMSWFPFVLM
jgi:hypothetical protein